MTTITNNNLINNLSASTQISNSALKSELASKISTLTKDLYLGPGYTNVPGLTNILFTPIDFYDSIKASYKAYTIGDKEGMFENSLRVAEAPFNLINAILQLSSYVIQAGIFFKSISESVRTTLLPLSTSLAGAGLIFSAIEGVLETHGLIRSINFLKDYYPADFQKLKESQSCSDPHLKNQKIYSCLKKILNESLPDSLKNEINEVLGKIDVPEEFSRISKSVSEKFEEIIYINRLNRLTEKFFEISPKKMREIDEYIEKNLSALSTEEKLKRKEQILLENLEKKKSRLIRRVNHRLADELGQKLPSLLQDLQGASIEKKAAAKERADELFKDIKIQSQKKLLIHTLGLTAVALTTAGLIMGLIACPYLIPFVFLVAGMVFALARYYLNNGLSDTKGWTFDAKRCAPNLLKRIHNQLTSCQKTESGSQKDTSGNMLHYKPYPEWHEQYSWRNLDYSMSLFARRA